MLSELSELYPEFMCSAEKRVLDGAFRRAENSGDCPKLQAMIVL